MRNDTSVPGHAFWWKQTAPEAVYPLVTQAINALDNRQRYRYERNLHHLKLYSNNALMELTGEGSVDREAPSMLLRLNLVQAVIDAACSQISTNRPRMYHLTVGGDWSQQRKAKQRTKFTDGQFYELDQYEKSMRVFQRAAIFGTGFQKIYAEDGKVQADIPFTDDILLDDREGRDGTPRQMFQYAEINREVLADKYPEYRDKIEYATAGMRRFHLRNQSIADQIGIMEAWHLPSGPGARDGLHALCISNATIIFEEYTRPYFPVVPFRWGQRPLGYWGAGLAETLSPLQIELNYLLQKIQRCMTLATSQIWVAKGTRVNKQTFSNEDWAVREYQGQPPTLMAVQAISPEYSAQVDKLWARGFEMTGVSQLAASSVKPAGLDSGKALETYNDISSQRFLQVGQVYEGFHKTVAERYIDCARDIAEEKGTYKVLGRSKKGFEYIKWADIADAEDDFAIQVYPTSFFSRTPSGKWKEVEQMMGAGFLSKDEAASLLDYPDLESVTAVRNAPFERLQMVVEDMLDHGEPRYPSPYDNLSLAAQWLPLVIAKGEARSAPEENLELLRQYLNSVQIMLNPPPPPPEETPIVGQQPQPPGSIGPSPDQLAALAGGPGAGQPAPSA